MGFERARRRLLQPHAAAPRVRVNRPFNAGTLNRAAAGMRVHLALHGIELNAPGASLQLHRAMNSLDALAARSGVGAQAGLAGDYQLVADRDVPAQPVVLGQADPDAVAGLRNGGIRLDIMDAGFVAAEEIVVRADDAVDAHAGSVAGAHLDAAGAGLDIQIDRAVDGESASKEPSRWAAADCRTNPAKARAAVAWLNLIEPPVREDRRRGWPNVSFCDRVSFMRYLLPL